MTRTLWWIFKSTSVLMFCSMVVTGHGQTQKEIFDNLKKKYPSSNEVVLLEEDKYIIKNKDGKLQIVKESKLENVIMSSSAINNVKESFHTSDFSKVTNHQAYSIDINNKKFDKTISIENNDNGDGIFYDDVRKIEITYPGIGVGSKKVLEYTTVFLDPHLLHPFLFIQNSPAEVLRFVVEVDQSVELEGRVFNDPNNTITFTKKQKGKQIIYTWESKNIPAFSSESGGLSVLHTEPHVALIIKSYQTDKGKEKVLGTVEDLYAYYWNFIKNVNNEKDTELEELVNRITQNITTEKEKVKAIYYWVKDNIKYIAYENGYGGYIPRDAKLVRDRKFGDCKDMSSILSDMCHITGVNNVYLTWIGTTKIPYTYQQLPTPNADNHMIATYMAGEEIIFLDATDSYSPFGMPSDFIQGKEALISLGENNFKVVQVPMQPPTKNKWIDSITINFEGDKILGNGVFQLTGYNKVDFIMGLTLSKEERFEIVKDFTLLGTNKYKLLDYELKNELDKDLPLIGEYNFELASYIIKLEDELFINPFMKSIPYFEPFKADRKNPFHFSNQFLLKNIMTINNPTGYELTAIPQPLTIDNNIFTFEAISTLQKEGIQLSYEVKIKNNNIYPADFESWNLATQEIKKYFKQNLIFKKKN